jgi:hypothetical protein
VSNPGGPRPGKAVLGKLLGRSSQEFLSCQQRGPAQGRSARLSLARTRHLSRRRRGRGEALSARRGMRRHIEQPSNGMLQA